MKKLHSSAVLPSYAKEGDAGLDLTATSLNTVNEGQMNGYQEYGTGLAFEIPDGFVGLLFPRSSVTNKAMVLKNSVGIIDSTYRGEVKLRFVGNEDYNIGDRIGQMIIMPFPKIEIEEAEELTTTERNQGGYGSTGN